MAAGEQDEPEQTPEEKRFIEGLIERGEAAEPDEHGKLPPGATHEIVERRADGTVRVKRRRFSMS